MNHPSNSMNQAALLNWHYQIPFNLIREATGVAMSHFRDILANSIIQRDDDDA